MEPVDLLIRGGLIVTLNPSLETLKDGSLAVRFGKRYLPVKECAVADKPKAALPQPPAKARGKRQRGSDWNKNFDMKKVPKVWLVAQASGYRQAAAD